MVQKFDITLGQINPEISNSITGIGDNNKCVIGINRDGVINEIVNPYCYQVADFIAIDRSMSAVSLLRSKNYKIVIFSDQGGIEKGLYTTHHVDATHEYMLTQFGNAGCTSIDAIYYSASSRKQDIYALPNVGMLKRCENENKHIRFKEGFFVGNTIKDIKAAVKIGATPILVRTGQGIETEKLLQKFTYTELKHKTRVYNDLFEFVSSLA